MAALALDNPQKPTDTAKNSKIFTRRALLARDWKTTRSKEAERECQHSEARIKCRNNKGEGDQGIKERGGRNGRERLCGNRSSLLGVLWPEHRDKGEETYRRKEGS